MTTYSPIESAIVRLLNSDNEPVGIGLLVDTSHIVTCAHVVIDALGRDYTEMDMTESTVKFDMLQASKGNLLSSRIFIWDEGADIVILEIYGALPNNAVPQPLLQIESVDDHLFSTYGVPKGNNNGVWISGVLQRAVSGGHIQIKDQNSFGHFVEPGFSGSPVLDKTYNKFIGIVVSADWDSANRTGFIIPTALIRQVWPDLPCILLENRENKIVSSVPPRLEPPRGTVALSSPFYIERRADQDCLNYFGQGRRITIYVQGPHQVGKSSLMQRTIHKLRQLQPIQCAFIDFQAFEQDWFTNFDRFLYEFCYSLSEELDVLGAIEQYWADANRGPTKKCARYLTEHILYQISEPVVIAMDKVERILGTPWQDDFFGMLRHWHNEGARKDNFARVSQFLSISTEPKLFIKNPNRSPFNVGQKIELEDFTMSEVWELCHRYRISLTKEEFDVLTSLLDGHPFLTHTALFQLSLHRYTFTELIQYGASDNGPFADHLNDLREQVIQKADLHGGVHQICKRRVVTLDEAIYTSLKGAGLVKRLDNRIVMRNKLYEQYFNRYV